jgi:hypothetical protein
VTSSGYLYATESGARASFVRRMASRHDTLRAAARWDTRFREGANYGFGPLRALRHWVGKPEDPDAGGIAVDAVNSRHRMRMRLWSSRTHLLIPEWLATAPAWLRRTAARSPSALHRCSSAPLLTNSFLAH